ncbi:MAG TPA: gamma-glutamyl-gamma-aminobutyrate hydrolase family protein [Acidobacteriaceae bacterium]|nr:gamma-glutamyl-gamma-aminobutyrate hydrolase family protein [Acidobacteriaceae bacterium]
MPVHIAIPEPSSHPAVADSAAYNLRSLPQYLHALHAAGATPIVVPLHESPQRVAKILNTVSGILLPGSPADIDPQKYGEHPLSQTAPPDSPRAAVDELLLQDAFNLHKPILAICQGNQSLNTWLNGALIQDIPSQIGTKVNHSSGRSVHEAHPIHITPGTRLAALIPANDAAANCNEAPFRTRREHGDLPLHDTPGHLWVNSSHHQAVRVPGDNLTISAVSPEDGVIEAVELANPHHFVLGIQWHPERTYDLSAFSRNIFAAFVHAAEQWTPRRIEESVLQA